MTFNDSCAGALISVAVVRGPGISRRYDLERRWAIWGPTLGKDQQNFTEPAILWLPVLCCALVMPVDATPLAFFSLEII